MSVTISTSNHYGVQALAAETGMATLREIFPDGEANDLNVCIFSTSGVHGSYETIEEVGSGLASGDGDGLLTVLVLHPRLVFLRYGSIKISEADVPYLVKLRESSRRVLSEI